MTGFEIVGDDAGEGLAFSFPAKGEILIWSQWFDIYDLKYMWRSPHLVIISW